MKAILAHIGPVLITMGVMFVILMFIIPIAICAFVSWSCDYLEGMR